MMPVFGPVQIEFCQALSSAIFEDARCKASPDFLVLAFWLREGHIKEWKHKSLDQRMPIGTVFHIPPRNVEVMAIYSWIVSLLMGNRNIIRISDQASEEFRYLLELASAVMCHKEFESIRLSTSFVHYGHDDALTQELSAQADVRIVWGGDAAVAHMTTIPLKKGGKQIAFPDRFSFAVVEGNVYCQANEEEKKRIAQEFFSDVYWFDQAGCSSPRLVFWYGQPSTAFYSYLQEEIERRNYRIPIGGVLSKMTHAYTMALSLPVVKVDRYSNELVVMTLEHAHQGVRDHCGQGLLYHVPIARWDELRDFVTEKDQSLVYCGLSERQIKEIKESLAGRGVTRYVRFSQALAFDPQWDGHDLMWELTKEKGTP